jgi:hypothetical protein
MVSPPHGAGPAGCSDEVAWFGSGGGSDVTESWAGADPAPIAQTTAATMKIRRMGLESYGIRAAAASFDHPIKSG